MPHGPPPRSRSAEREALMAGFREPGYDATPSPPPPQDTMLDLRAAPVPLPVSRSRRRSHLLRALLAAPSHPRTPRALRRALSREPDVSPSDDASPASLHALVVAYDTACVTKTVAHSTAELRKASVEAESHPNAACWLSLPACPAPCARKFLSDELGIPQRALDDAAAGVPRAKVELFVDADAAVAHVPVVSAARPAGELAATTVTLVMLPVARTVVTLHDGPAAAAWRAHVLDVVHADVAGVRSRHVAHLICAMLDSVLESYFVALEHLGEALDELEWQVLHDDDDDDDADDEDCEAREVDATPLRPRDVLRLITRVKHELGLLRRQIWPLRECLTRLAVAPEALVDAEARLRVRESLDRTMQVLDVLECYRDVGHALLDLHLAAQNNRMQEVMQALAVVTTIFVPLTFLAGIEGMNFSNQPELHGRWSYFLFWILVCAILAGQVVFFRKKGWI